MPLPVVLVVDGASRFLAEAVMSLSSSRSRIGLLYMSIRISKRSSNSPQSMPKRAEMTEVSIGEVQTYIVLCGEGTLVPQWE